MKKPQIKTAAVSQTPDIRALANKSYQPTKPVIPSNTARHPKNRRAPWVKMAVLIIVIVFSMSLGLVVWNVRNFQNVSQKLFGTDNAWEVLQTTELKKTADGRTNILVVGYSIDDPNHGGAQLTDSILVISLDASNQSGYMLSVPRDLYVNIPGYGAAKINEAYPAGQNMKFREAGYPRGGMGLLQKVINDNFAIKIHYNAIINYTAVKEVVDALGGIEVTIKSPDKRGIYDPNFPKNQGGPLKLTNGKHKIDGQTALRLTRARGLAYNSYGFPLSDFNRTQNQQQVFASIKNQLDWTLVLDPRTNGEIFEAAGNNLKTNVKIGEVIPLYRLFVSVPSDQLKPISLRVLNGINLLNGTTINGQQVLFPSAGMNDYSQIQAHIKKLSK